MTGGLPEKYRAERARVYGRETFTTPAGRNDDSDADERSEEIPPPIHRFVPVLYERSPYNLQNRSSASRRLNSRLHDLPTLHYKVLVMPRFRPSDSRIESNSLFRAFGGRCTRAPPSTPRQRSQIHDRDSITFPSTPLAGAGFRAGPAPEQTEDQSPLAQRLPRSQACHRSDQTASSFPFGSVKWKRRPPGNSNIS